MPVQSNAHPFDARGGRTGVLLLHGFTGSPASMRPWGEHLAAEGFSVSVPRLPGHGTSWQDLNKTEWTDWLAEASRSFDHLRESCDEVFLFGLSMGGCLSLRLAEERGDEVAGLVLVNPIITTTNRLVVALPVLKRVVGSLPGVTNDIKKPGADEYGYDRMPLRALDSMRTMWQVTRDDLAKVTMPLLVFRSVEDHVVEPVSTQIITQRVSSRDATERVLDNSYHVATLDYDADSIFKESVDFVRKHSTVGSGAE